MASQQLLTGCENTAVPEVTATTQATASPTVQTSSLPRPGWEQGEGRLGMGAREGEPSAHPLPRSFLSYKLYNSLFIEAVACRGKLSA